ncbi:MAG: hypothetical protein OEV49_05855 [candidate division Zixibacteria bacterium]|nr:hypothetical protein [candidate division Zixibacteria bacterium]MDH3938615.1 hypothetical protein [candidate division Zixibacteria bacterium]MDH4035169.1 hypothetical protein [candidate division Zixibacteria bacterium]
MSEIIHRRPGYRKDTYPSLLPEKEETPGFSFLWPKQNGLPDLLSCRVVSLFDCTKTDQIGDEHPPTDSIDVPCPQGIC